MERKDADCSLIGPSALSCLKEQFVLIRKGICSSRQILFKNWNPLLCGKVLGSELLTDDNYWSVPLL